MDKRRDLRSVFWLDDRKERAFYILVLFLGFWRLGRWGWELAMFVVLN